MTDDKKKKIYLAGAMTAKKDLGRTWRKNITPFLKKLGFEIEDPTVFEKEIWQPLIQDHKCESMRELKIKKPAAHADIMKLIEEHDIHRMLSCDVAIFLIDPAVFKSDGTISEIREAIPYGQEPKLECIFLLRMPWHKVWSWTAWRLRRYGEQQNKLFYNWSDLKLYMAGRYGNK